MFDTSTYPHAFPHIFEALDNALKEIKASAEYYREQCDVLHKKVHDLQSELDRMDKLLSQTVNPGKDNNGEVR
jgi:chaperonin cofactor prefoldin